MLKNTLHTQLLVLTAFQFMYL